MIRQLIHRIKSFFRFRSAETGRFITRKEAELNPSTSVKEEVPHPDAIAELRRRAARGE